MPLYDGPGFVGLLMDIWVIFTFWLLGNMLLRTFEHSYRSLSGRIFLFSWVDRCDQSHFNTEVVD